jgi:isocitrate/isopropylmalate dehydrogenase
MKTYTITVIPGDGIGKEVVPEGLRVLEAVAAKFGFGFRFRHFEWSCESYKATGRMTPEECHHKGTERHHPTPPLYVEIASSAARQSARLW